MRFIVVDVGNTSTAIGKWIDGRVSQVKHIDGAGDEALKAAQSFVSAKFDAVAYASVVPKRDRRWKSWARHNRLEFLQVSADRLGSGEGAIRLDYPEPSTIGADRLADAVGAVERYGAPVLVMDFGTALTAAVITGDRVWRGGVIAPGFPLMRDYLFERTAKLPRMSIGTGKAPKIGRTTEEAMRFGALVGYRGMVREIVGELQHNFKTKFKLVATGGFARWVLKDISMPFIIDSTLTLYGVGLICSKSYSRLSR